MVTWGEIVNHAPNGHSKKNPTPIVLVPLQCDRVNRKENVGHDHLDGFLSGDKRGRGDPPGAAHSPAIQLLVFGDVSRCDSANFVEAASAFLGWLHGKGGTKDLLTVNNSGLL